MENLSRSSPFFDFGFVLLSLYLLLSSNAANASPTSLPKPNPKNAAATARWLVGQNSLGIISTSSSNVNGAHFISVPFSDGLPGSGRGIPYFYIGGSVQFPVEALKGATTFFTVSEYQLGTCGKNVSENPTCSVLTLAGKLQLIDQLSSEAMFAKKALFTKHPEMMAWPESPNLKIYRLDIEHIFMRGESGRAMPITPAHYLSYGN